MYHGKIFPTKTRKVSAIIAGIAGAVIIILTYINAISQALTSLFLIGYLAVGLLSLVLINHYEKKQTNKQANPSQNTPLPP
jgi:hypothetical protein